MRFGVALIPRFPVDTLSELAREAELLGFDDIWLPDHYFARDTYSALTLIADRTDRVRLGPGVASPYLRHPALLASVTATLGEISDGRAVLGIGPGGFEFPTHLQMSIPKPLSATREAIELIRELWGGGRASYEGEAFSLESAAIDFYDTFDAPIYMAARGPRMLGLSGRIADGVITHGISQAHVEHVLGLVREGEQESPDAAPTSIAFWLDSVIDDDLDRARDQLRKACIVMAGGTYSDSLIEVYGLDRDAVYHLREAVVSGDWDEAESRVTDDMVDAFCLAGSAERCRAGVDRLVAAGVDEIIVATTPFGDVDEVRAGLEAVADAFDVRDKR